MAETALQRLAFAALGGGTLLLYLLWSAWVPLLPDHLSTPLLDLGKIAGATWPSLGRLAFLIGALFALYLAGYRLVARGLAGPGPVFGFAALFSLALCWAYPATAADVFGYVAQGRLLALHGANPFQVAPIAYPQDPIVPYLAWPHEPSQYGPLWALLGAATTRLAGADLLGEVLLYKAVAIAAHLGAALLALAVASRLTPRPERALAGAYLYAWNPLLLWESAANAHNDALVALGLLLVAWLLSRRLDLLALPALALAALAKLSAAAIAPPLALALWRRQRLAAVFGALLALGLAAALYWPFWFGPRTITALERGDLFTTSLASSLLHLLRPIYGEQEAMRLARWLCFGLLAATLIPILWQARRTQTTLRALALCYAAMLAFLLLGITWFQPWYVAWPFALGAALPLASRHHELVALSFGALSSYLLWSFLWPMDAVPGGPDVARHVAYAMVVGPLLALWASRLARRLLARAAAARTGPRVAARRSGG